MFYRESYQSRFITKARTFASSSFLYLGDVSFTYREMGDQQLILVQQKRRSKNKDKRDASGKLGWHPFSKQKNKDRRMDFHKLCPSLCSGVKISFSHIGEEGFYLYGDKYLLLPTGRPHTSQEIYHHLINQQHRLPKLKL